MSQFEFEFPYAFLLILLFWFCFKRCPAKGVAIYLPYVHLLIGKKGIKSRWLDIFKWISIVALVTALASPVKVTTFNNVKKEGRDIMLILDSSESMNERGFDLDHPKRDKFSTIIDVIKEFINKRKDDRIGLINFSSSAFIASPLTFDREYLKNILSKQKVGIVGRRTAIYDALLQGLYILENSKSKSKIALLLTDGVDNMSQIGYKEIEDLLKKSDIKLYIVGIGNREDLDTPKLKELAKVGRGKLFLAKNKKALDSVYKDIDNTETTKIDGKSYRVFIYYYYYPLIFAIVFMLLYVYFKSVKGVAKR